MRVKVGWEMHQALYALPSSLISPVELIILLLSGPLAFALNAPSKAHRVTPRDLMVPRVSVIKVFVSASEQYCAVPAPSQVTQPHCSKPEHKELDIHADKMNGAYLSNPDLFTFASSVDECRLYEWFISI